MRFVFFCHSVTSDWNNGNAHFQRGVVSELLSRGHAVTVFEPRDGWSAKNLIEDAGPGAASAFERHYPNFDVQRYELGSLDLERALAGADVVVVHEWSEPELVRALGQRRARGGRYLLFFHDTHHRMVTAPAEMYRFEFDGYDAVLAFGEALRERYRDAGWGDRAFTWHEAADTRVFYPRPAAAARHDVVWVGNWGDEERSQELDEFLLAPVKGLGLSSRVYGVRYPAEAKERLQAVGADYGGWLPNYEVPGVFAAARVTVHVPRRPYAAALPGIPTIRPFEALSCGVVLLSAPWQDSEGLFRVDRDFLMVRDGAEMQRRLRDVLEDAALARELRESGLETIRARHTCAHRVDELLSIVRRLRAGAEPERRGFGDGGGPSSLTEAAE